MKKKHKLTGRELDTLRVLWDSTDALTASDITKANPELNINTVQSTLKKLIQYKFITISDIVQRNTVLARAYRPIIMEDDYLMQLIHNSAVPIMDLVTRIVTSELSDEQRKELEKQLKDLKAK